MTQNTIHISINDKPITCFEGESILQIARREGIEIPAICYLSGCSPTMACKLCMIDADGKRNYSCNTKAKEGMNIYTHTPEINQERQAIMQSYDVNHPLQCGVCDKSGECELQNYTLKMNVQAQEYCIKESDKPHKLWAKAVYDPNLCIMCERCATTCKDHLGEANLKAQKAALEPLDLSLWKDKMPKDALSVWARKQKALIEFVGESPCFDCGECISVCPVGALSTNDFKYKANAWELKQIESTCVHCAMGCKIIYEVRHCDAQGTPHIYRVKNDFHFNPICGAGRYAYDICSTSKPNQNLQAAIEAFKKAKAINVGHQSTNEEAFVLNHLAKSLQLKLYNPQALHFKNFIYTFLSYAQSSTLTHLEDIKNTHNIIILGNAIKHNVPTLRYMINNKLKLDKSSQVIYMHPVEDALIQSLSKNLKNICYDFDSLPIALGSIALAACKEIPQTLQNHLQAIIDTYFIRQEKILKESKKTITTTSNDEQGNPIQTPQEIIEQIEETKEIPTYQMLLDSGISQEDFENLQIFFASENTPLLIVGNALYQHPQSALFAKILGLLQLEGKLKVLLVPPFANALGLAMICDFSPLDTESSPEYTIGFRERGDFILDSNYISQDLCSCPQAEETTLTSPHFILPALNQMEGTYTSIDSRILPLKPALPFEGYDLNDIAQAFDMKGEYLIDYTSLICGCEFDDFENRFLHDGSNLRGYRFKNIAISPTIHSPELTDLLSKSTQKGLFNAYMLHSPSQFNTYTAKSENLQNKVGIYMNPALMQESHIQEGDVITLTDSIHRISGKAFVDYHLKQPIYLINPMLDGAKEIFANQNYAFLTLESQTRSGDE